MRLFVILVMMALMASAASTCPATAWHNEPSQSKSDPISVEWEASFEASNGKSFALTLKLKLDGDKITGTYVSVHTGGGQISKGTWAANKNKIGLAIETGHGTMVITGLLKDGKLAGEFDAGQMQGKWEAQKK